MFTLRVLLSSSSVFKFESSNNFSLHPSFPGVVGDKLSPCTPSWSKIVNVDQAGIELTEICPLCVSTAGIKGVLHSFCKKGLPRESGLRPLSVGL